MASNRSQDRAQWTRHVTGRRVKEASAALAEQPAKYRNRKTTLDGMTFDSAKEARRWQELKLLEAAGEIRRLRRQPRYSLFALPHAPGASAIVGHFTPDFGYVTRDGLAVIEDVKSPITRKETAYRLRKKLFEANYGVTVTEV